MFLPVCTPTVPRNALAYTRAVIEANWVSSVCKDPALDFIGKLERGFAELTGAAHAVAVTSGTAALQLAVAALRLGPGDEVILPATTMIASAAAVAHAGATPVIVDVDPATYCLSTAIVTPALTPRTKAIMPVHLYGYPAEMASLLDLARHRQLRIIEDAAEAIGTRYRNRHVGTFGDVGCFSFYANKMMTSGEGGMAVTNDPVLAKRLRRLKDHCFGEPRFLHEELGFNFRMSNLTAAYGYASFEELPRAIARRSANAKRYIPGLAALPGVTLPPDSPDVVNSHWMVAITIDSERFGLTKDAVRQSLRERFHIDSRDFFYPLHLQPALQRQNANPQSLPVAERLWREGLYLPSSSDLTPAEIDRVVQALTTLHQEAT
ncbi:MAG: hypothetical protein A2289_13155 [Deltaproteobacteria bacterium RIFOXYA12_FULL_58_15]|nr:MAG: hypothetical protein A2289_13155 [Deltaproteobacteria bacterium RIFOXYA12_FULL_58_15]OGR09439.1 MAG: hypothetical protein A2341_18145 [Deltaproteobacteria bacterium RIFOXYB12_FULL_58_9]